MIRPIGYYVHHHGDGHRQRALAIASKATPQRVTLLGTGLQGRTGSAPAIDLPDDRGRDNGEFDGIDGTTTRPLALHYAPLNHEGVRVRMGLIARWISEAKPALMVVDVSVEIAMLARLCATPVAFVRLSGRRDDPAHCEAYRAASLIIAPFAQQLDDTGMPPWVRDNSIYLPGIVAARPVTNEVTANLVLVVVGKGGIPMDSARLVEAAAMTPGKHWRVIGPVVAPSVLPENLEFAGWVDDAAREIACSEIVIGAAGDGLVNAVIAAARPFICLPEPRPFDEQVQKARALKASGAAVVLESWPDPVRWPTLLDDAMRLDPNDLAALDDIDGASKAWTTLRHFADAQK